MHLSSKFIKRLASVRCGIKGVILISSLKLSLVARQPTPTFGKLYYSGVADQVGSKFQISKLERLQFEKYSEATLGHLVDRFEDLVQTHGAKDFDVEYSSGVLTLSLGQFGTYVINKQPPNGQIWLSSPISGPKRYDFDIASGQWFYHRDGTTLTQLLEAELHGAFGVEVRI